MTVQDTLEYAADGMTAAEIAAEQGLSTDAVRRRLKRRNIRVPRETELTPRQRAERMKPLEAVDYLLNIIDDLTRGAYRVEHAVDGWGMNLTISERTMLIMLYTGKPTTTEALYSTLYSGRGCADDLPDPTVIRMYISKIRTRLPPERGVIKTIWGHGYRFHRAGVTSTDCAR